MSQTNTLMANRLNKAIAEQQIVYSELHEIGKALQNLYGEHPDKNSLYKRLAHVKGRIDCAYDNYIEILTKLQQEKEEVSKAWADIRRRAAEPLFLVKPEKDQADKFAGAKWRYIVDKSFFPNQAEAYLAVLNYVSTAQRTGIGIPGVQLVNEKGEHWNPLMPIPSAQTDYIGNFKQYEKEAEKSRMAYTVDVNKYKTPGQAVNTLLKYIQDGEKGKLPIGVTKIEAPKDAHRPQAVATNGADFSKIASTADQIKENPITPPPPKPGQEEFYKRFLHFWNQGSNIGLVTPPINPDLVFKHKPGDFGVLGALAKDLSGKIKIITNPKEFGVVPLPTDLTGESNLILKSGDAAKPEKDKQDEKPIVIQIMDSIDKGVSSDLAYEFVGLYYHLLLKNTGLKISFKEMGHIGRIALIIGDYDGIRVYISSKEKGLYSVDVTYKAKTLHSCNDIGGKNLETLLKATLQ